MLELRVTANNDESAERPLCPADPHRTFMSPFPAQRNARDIFTAPDWWVHARRSPGNRRTKLTTKSALAQLCPGPRHRPFGTGAGRGDNEASEVPAPCKIRTSYGVVFPTISVRVLSKNVQQIHPTAPAHTHTRAPVPAREGLSCLRSPPYGPRPFALCNRRRHREDAPRRSKSDNGRQTAAPRRSRRPTGAIIEPHTGSRARPLCAIRPPERASRLHPSQTEPKHAPPWDTCPREGHIGIGSNAGDKSRKLRKGGRRMCPSVRARSAGCMRREHAGRRIWSLARSTTLRSWTGAHAKTAGYGPILHAHTRRRWHSPPRAAPRRRKAFRLAPSGRGARRRPASGLSFFLSGFCALSL
ncbi:hypothetical protein C8Q76DRAFT_289688 [Earliella scabrosa]|nr:hypothetical protein C8Q76DRAFT_289688 [Earliella scabrosa]